MTLTQLSHELAQVIEKVAPSLVRIDDGTRLTASGVVWSSEGIIVATSHGVERDNNLFVETHDGTRLPTTLLGRDPHTDIAVLRVNDTNLKPLERASADTIKTGQLALAVGMPGSPTLQATLGIINARADSQYEGSPEYVLYTDATLYPGFSGGALVNTQAQGMGLLNRAFGRGRGVALGLPIVRRVVDHILQHGAPRRGYIGIATQPVELQHPLREAHNIQQPRALLVVQVGNQSPAERSGLMIGDLLLQVNNEPLVDAEQLRRHLKAGATLSLTILRGGMLQQTNVPVDASA